MPWAAQDKNPECRHDRGKATHILVLSYVRGKVHLQ
jgi:hypothetical protein